MLPNIELVKAAAQKTTRAALYAQVSPRGSRPTGTYSRGTTRGGPLEYEDGPTGATVFYFPNRVMAEIRYAAYAHRQCRFNSSMQAARFIESGEVRCQTIIGELRWVDHRIPLSRGGTNWPDNVVISCPSCNLRKMPEKWIARLRSIRRFGETKA